MSMPLAWQTALVQFVINHLRLRSESPARYAFVLLNVVNVAIIAKIATFPLNCPAELRERGAK